MKGFKLIAIRTGEKSNNENENYFKVLKAYTIYSFYNGYEYPKNDFTEIYLPPQENIDLYKIEGKNISVNISAIVGMNGSGKSTLLELLFLANYNIGCTLGILKDCELKENLNIEIFYFLNADYYCLRFYNSTVKICKYGRTNWTQHTSSLFINSEEYIDHDSLTKFFYTIVINYSHHSLNTNEIGDWIRPLFHKNDGYQTPIVLNPMRTAGNFDINRENSLLERRLLANVLEPLEGKAEINSLRNISNGKIAQTLKLKHKIYEPYKDLQSLLNFEMTKYRNTDIEPAIGVLQDKISDSNNTYKPDDKVLHNLYQVIKEVYLFPDGIKGSKRIVFEEMALKYIYAKIMKTARADIYIKMKNEKRRVNFFNPEEVKAFITDSRKSNSHIFFKIKGVILYLKYFDLLLPNFDGSGEYKVSVDDLSQAIKTIQDKESDIFINTFMMCPPSFFDTEIILSFVDTETELSMKQLSSGEKQKIHSINSIAYHLIFLNSVDDNGTIGTSNKNIERIAKYKNINIVLDEIELYYHPEWQRTYIHDLLKTFGLISESNSKNIYGINIIISTHSPFVLSDIPDTNILYLEDGEQVKVQLGTLGANVHQLLRNSFFMKNGAMGKLIKIKIESLLKFLNSDEKENQTWNDIRARELISMVGEPFIKQKLMELYDNKFSKQMQIESLQKELDRLKAKK